MVHNEQWHIHLNGCLEQRHHTEAYRVAVTGHRNLQTLETVQFVTEAFEHILTDIRERCSLGVVAVSGLAEGADTIFAETALALSIPLESVIAYEGLIGDFPHGPSRECYLRLREQSRHVHMLPFYRRSNKAYMALGYWLVQECDLLVAAWNGLPAAGEGGTGDVVAYARQEGRPILHIHTVERHIQLL